MRSANRRGTGIARQARRGRGSATSSASNRMAASRSKRSAGPPGSKTRPPSRTSPAVSSSSSEGTSSASTGMNRSAASSRSRVVPGTGSAIGRSSLSRKPPATSWTRPDGSTPSRVQSASSPAASRPGTNRADARAGPVAGRRRSWNATRTVIVGLLPRARPTAAPRRSARRRPSSAGRRSAGSSPGTSRPASRPRNPRRR